MLNDAFIRFDYSDLIAACDVDLRIAGLTWHSPLVAQWMGEIGAPRADWLDVDGFYWLLERLAIAIEDGGLHG